MNIAAVITSYYPRWGGTENQLRRQAAELARRGHHVNVITWQHDPTWPRQELVDGVRVIRVPRTRGAIVAGVRMLWTLLRTTASADAVAAHQLLYPAYLAAWAAVLTRTRMVAKAATTASCPGSDVGALVGTGLRTRARRVLAAPLLRLSTGIALSGEMERDLRDVGFRKVVRIPNGVESRPLADRLSLRQELLAPIGIPASGPVVATAGRLVWWKGFGCLVDAWTQVVDRHNDAHLVIVGSGPEEDALRLRIERNGVDDRVHLVSARFDSCHYLGASDVVVVPSFYEGMSNVMLEGLALGVPVVATSVSGAVDVIQDGETGYLVRPNNAGALAEGIMRALCEPRNIGARGMERVMSLCSLATVVDSYERAFAVQNLNNGG